MFSQRFNKGNEIHISDCVVDLLSLELIEMTNLQVLFEEEEICRALMDTEGDKAPGPNGFPFWLTQSFETSFGKILLVCFRYFKKCGV